MKFIKFNCQITVVGIVLLNLQYIHTCIMFWRIWTTIYIHFLVKEYSSKYYDQQFQKGRSPELWIMIVHVTFRAITLALLRKVSIYDILSGWRPTTITDSIRNVKVLIRCNKLTDAYKIIIMINMSINKVLRFTQNDKGNKMQYILTG